GVSGVALSREGETLRASDARAPSRPKRTSQPCDPSPYGLRLHRRWRPYLESLLRRFFWSQLRSANPEPRPSTRRLPPSRTRRDRRTHSFGLPGVSSPQSSSLCADLSTRGSGEYLSPSARERTRPREVHSYRQGRSEEHTSELQSRFDIVCRLLLEKKKE